MSDDVLCVRYSHTKDPARLLVAVALLDCTVKVFFDDSLKFFLSLYGHKLPVLSMDISSDNALLVRARAAACACGRSADMLAAMRRSLRLRTRT